MKEITRKNSEIAQFDEEDAKLASKNEEELEAFIKEKLEKDNNKNQKKEGKQ